MASKVVIKALNIINDFLFQNYSNHELKIIQNEINKIVNFDFNQVSATLKMCTYEELQSILSTLNEKESDRKSNGVYYTPNDVVKFILINSVKLSGGILKPNNVHVTDLNGVPYRKFCYEKTVYDPTCGSGAFLLETLETKLDLLELHNSSITRNKIHQVISTINGNDLNKDSIIITKIRLLICVLHRYGVAKIKGISEILNKHYANYDFVSTKPDTTKQYDIILGNPPYVEDNNSESKPPISFGNIYANVLENAALHLKPNGVIGFVIPLSYVSTPRMEKIRNKMFEYVAEQYLLSYSDRPDCLFTSVHQKLCILFGKNSVTKRKVYTGNYRYWYREERQDLFNTEQMIKNTKVSDGYIPKLGTKLDLSIYSKVTSKANSILDLLENNIDENDNYLYLNMRATFWIKAFLNEHAGSEYKKFKFSNENDAKLCMCLLNSSLFWWYWISVSDCWHITRKELRGFTVPYIINFDEINRLAVNLETKLEETKKYVGTKQTEYVYKHKDCLKEIHQIDDYINNLFGLTETESLYIKNFAFRYRVSGGTNNECN